MTAFLIGAAELAALAAGTPMLVVAPGMALEPEALPITVLRPVAGVLRQQDGPPGPALPLPPGLRPLASVAPDAAAAEALALAAGLPAGVPALPANALRPALIARLVAALAEAEALRGDLHRRLAAQPVAAPRRVIDLGPVAAGPVPPPRALQPLGRGAEGLCGVALHLAAPATDAASLLRVRLVAGGRILGAWTVPGRDLAAGWVPLDLPEPAPAGSGEAQLEITLDAAEGDQVRISSGGADAGAPLALRVWAAEPGHLRVPRHFDWAARDLPAPAPGLVLPLPDGAWAGATLQGATGERIGLGSEAPRLLLSLAPGAEARLGLPPLPAGPADLAMLEVALRQGEVTAIEVALAAAAAEAPDSPRHSGWRRLDDDGALRVALPLPAAPSGAIELRLIVRNTGPAANLEVSRLALATGAAGVPRREPDAQVTAPEPQGIVPASAAPPAEAAPVPSERKPAAPPAIRIAAAPPSPVPPAGPRTPLLAPTAPPPPTAPAPSRVMLPSGGPSRPAGAPPAGRPALDATALPQVFGGLSASRGSAFRVAAPQPPLTVAGAGGPAAPPAAAATPPPATTPLAFAQDTPTATAWRDLKLNQHLVNKEGTYQHLDLAITGLVAPAGLWRQVRTKLFDRRGTVGLEFRSIKGWPQMFDQWPGSQVDNFGPLWRLEHAAPGEALAQLSTPHDRALIAAVLEVLPSLAIRACSTPAVPPGDGDAWAERARLLATAVAEALRA